MWGDCWGPGSDNLKILELADVHRLPQNDEGSKG